jgi:acyl-CoA thioester hydrolase
LTGLNKPVFEFPVRIYYEDTDAAGIVYYANYLRYMERARTEWLREQGYALDEIEKQYRFVFAVRSANVEYLVPARLNDLVRVQVIVSRLGKASLDIDQDIYLDQKLICRGKIKLAGLNAETLRPMAIPIPIIN